MAASHWVSLGFFKSTWRGFHHDWKQTPPAARRRWLVTLVVGFVAAAALMAGITLVAKAGSDDLTALDERGLRRIEAGPVSFSNAILLESFGNLAYMVPLTLATAVVAARAHRPLLALAFPVAYVLQRPLVLIGWQLWNRERPKLIAGGIAAPGLHSFPSGHVALTLAVYGLLTWLWVRAAGSAAERALAIALLAALLITVGWARLRLGTHWPSDVLAGYVIGGAWLATNITALRRAEAAGGR